MLQEQKALSEKEKVEEDTRVMRQSNEAVLNVDSLLFRNPRLEYFLVIKNDARLSCSLGGMLESLPGCLALCVRNQLEHAIA
jgi:hypothetical protein